MHFHILSQSSNEGNYICFIFLLLVGTGGIWTFPYLSSKMITHMYDWSHVTESSGQSRTVILALCKRYWIILAMLGHALYFCRKSPRGCCCMNGTGTGRRTSSTQRWVSFWLVTRTAVYFCHHKSDTIEWDVFHPCWGFSCIRLYKRNGCCDTWSFTPGSVIRWASFKITLE